MRPLDHREPGILGVALSEDSLFAELICDGIHTTPEIVRIWSRCKGPHRGLLVTDAMSATGMPDGEYRLGGLTVTVANGRATSGDILAGSVLTLDRALANFLRFTGSTLEHGLRLLTTNPAAMLASPGLAPSPGHIAEGLPANFVAVNPDGTLAASILHGQQVA
jgi:N-acetylglucosamine-6-phosphate deacetylase